MPTHLPIDVLRPVPYWWKDIFPLFHRCRQRILVVTDGGLSFNPASGFGLSRFIDELAKITPTPTITKAHRGTDATADKQNFVFDSTVTTANYDQIWLFGIASAPVLSDPQIKVLADFMNAGGGLFATGDHSSLGYAMSGELPRVRKMRDWSGVPMVIERIDTVTNPGPDRQTQFDDQSDEFPQRIFPHYYGSGSSWSPHPLLRSPQGDIDVLPDHPHESVCLVGPNLGDPYNQHGLNFPEFPVFNGAPLAPVVIATAMSAGRYLNPPGSVVGKPPTTPRAFGAISTWDGYRVGRGRIACDATWHHFVNINLDGTGAVPAPGNNRRGLRDAALNFTPEFHQIAEYYRNIADWITPSARRWCRWWIDILVERFRFPLIEEWIPCRRPPCPWEERVRLGELIEDAFIAHRGPGFAEELTGEALTAAGLEEFAALVEPRRPDDPQRARQAELLVDIDALRRGVLGGIADAFMRDLPENPAELPKALDKHEMEDDVMRKLAVEAAGSAVESAREYYATGAKQTLEFLERCAHHAPSRRRERKAETVE